MVRVTVLEIYTTRTGQKIPYVDENPGLYLRIFNILATVCVRIITVWEVTFQRNLLPSCFHPDNERWLKAKDHVMIMMMMIGNGKNFLPLSEANLTDNVGYVKVSQQIEFEKCG